MWSNGVSRQLRVTLTALVMAAAAATGQEISNLDLPSLGPGRTPPGARYLSMQVIPSLTQVKAGGQLTVSLEMDVAEGWVFYSPAPGGSKDYQPMPARLEVQAGPWRVASVAWSPDHPHQTDLGTVQVTNHVYTGKAFAFVRFQTPEGQMREASRPGPGEIRVILTGQLCSAAGLSCLPVRLDGQAAVPLGPRDVPHPDWTDSLAQQLRQALPADELARRHEGVAATGDGQTKTAATVRMTAAGGIALCLLAGLILNAMPCVLPVVPLRVLSLLELARQSRRRYVVLGLAFAGGILVFFVGLATANVILRVATSHALTWAEHFQSEALRIAMGLLMVALAGNLFGLYEVLVPARLAASEGPPMPGSLGAQLLSSAGMGLIMAVLATPCSFAVLATALAWAQLQPLWLGTVGLLTMGVGMALPHAVLAGFPRLLDALPRPGRWMELLRQSMGFLMLLVAVWLFSTLSAQGYPFRVVGYGVVLAFSLWMWGSWPRHGSGAGTRWSLRAVALAVALAGGAWLLPRPGGGAVEFAPFDQQRIDSALARGQPVLVKFTASWCLSCRIIDYRVYEQPAVVQRLGRGDALVMKGDVTTADLPANRLLYQELQGAPPLTVIFRPHGPPIRLEGKFPPRELLEALDQAVAPASPG